MRKLTLVTILGIILSFSFSFMQVYGQQETLRRALYAEPGISPDGEEIAFVSGGDIWTVPATGGEARLLVAHPAYESRPLYAPDGKSLAFVSTRTGNGDIYLLSLVDGTLKRMTYDDGYEELSGWSADGRFLYFHSASGDIAGMNDIWRVAVEGGQPMPLTADRYATEYHGTSSPDGRQFVFVGRGMAAAQWWRRGSSHLDQTELWIMNLRQPKTPSAYRQLSKAGARQVWPMWDAMGDGIYFVSDSNGNQNLWYTDLKGQSAMLTAFEDGRVLWPSIANKTGIIVFERDFQLWQYDIAKKEAKPIQVTLKGAGNKQEVNFEQLQNNFQGLKVSPDGKKVAFVARGELFAAAAKDGGDAMRITKSLGIAANPVWSKDSRKVFFTRFGPEGSQLLQHDFATQQTEEISIDKGDLSSLVLSPDGLYLAFLRDMKALVVLDLAKKSEKVLYKGHMGRMSFSGDETIAWSPDNKWLAFAHFDVHALRNISVVAAAGGEHQPISYLSNTFGSGPEWSADGRYIYFGTAQRTEDARIARVDLHAKNKHFKEDDFYKLFEDNQPTDNKTTAAKPKDSTQVAINFTNIKSRLTFMPFDVSVGAYTLSPDGKRMAFTTNQLGQQTLFMYTLDESANNPKPRLLHTSSERTNNLQFSADNKQLFFTQGGKIHSIGVEGGDNAAKPLAVTAELEIDFEQEKLLLVHQAWEVLHRGFYDPDFHGTDWNAMLKAYSGLAQRIQTPDELRRLLNLMVGEMNASHMGVSAPGAQKVVTGRLGLGFDVEEYRENGRFKVDEVLLDGPAAVTGEIAVGDYLLSIDGQHLDSLSNIEQLMENRIAKKVVLGVQKKQGEEKVGVAPINLAAEKQLRYRQWVEQQRAYVERESKGRLGYVHMLNMSAEALEQLYLDLDAQTLTKEGVVIDIRNNNGGFVNAYALDVFTRRPYLTMTGRDMPSAPARIQLGQRALQKPTVLIINQHALSDAEDFTEGYKALQLGKVIGEPTAGWIIFTSAAQLLDGSNIRLPFSKITDNKGENMELNPRKPDVFSHRPMGESYGQQAVQLDVAIKELLNEIK